MPTIRDIIKEKSIELRNVSSLGPHKASEELVLLSSLLSSLNEHISEKAYWLNFLKAQKLQELGIVAKAKMVSEGTNEWKEWHEASLQKEALVELIRSLKVYIRNASEELREFTQ